MTLQSALVESLLGNVSLVLGPPSALARISMGSCSGVLEGLRVVDSLMQVVLYGPLVDFVNPEISLPAIGDNYGSGTDESLDEWDERTRVTLLHDHSKDFAETTFVSAEVYWLVRVRRVRLKPLDATKYPAAFDALSFLRECQKRTVW